MAFDRIGARAWALAIWIVEDENLASQILVAAFAQAAREARTDPQHDPRLLADVRRRAIDAVANLEARRPVPEATVIAALPRVREAIAGLPEPQRETFELALLGRLETPTIAATLGLLHSDVVTRLVDAMAMMHAICGRQVAGVDLQRTSRGLPSDEGWDASS